MVYVRYFVERNPGKTDASNCELHSILSFIVACYSGQLGFPGIPLQS